MDWPWYDVVRLVLYIAWGVLILLVVKLLAVRSRWRHPFRGNGPMLWALLLILGGVEWARARSIGTPAPPPYLPSLFLNAAATVLIYVWLYQQMELLPRWLRERIRVKRQKKPPRPSPADYTSEEDELHAEHG